MTKDRLWQHGEDYAGDRLDVDTVAAEPFTQFRAWFRAAEERKLPKVNAMTLATADSAGRPSARLVLLKELDARGFVFFTNYASRKGNELDANPWAALVFYWDPLDRQVRVEGRVERVTDAESDAYFAVRPREARLGAIASPQSMPLAGRAELEARLAEVASRVGDADPPRPPWWGGLRVIPERVEFWQGQPSRLHDRVEYTRGADGWTLRRLAP